MTDVQTENEEITNEKASTHHVIQRMATSVCRSLTQHPKAAQMLCYIGLLLLIILREPAIVCKPYLLGEDGSVFFQRAFDYGFRALFMPYRGYFLFVQQFIALISTQISQWVGNLVFAAEFMKWCAILYSAFSVWYFCTDQFKAVVHSQLYRFLIAAACIAFNFGTGEVWFTVTNAQWWSGIFVFLFGLDVVANGKLPGLRWMPAVLFLTILSTPIGVLIVPICLYAVFVKRYVKHQRLELTDWLYLLVPIVPLLIQMLEIGALYQGQFSPQRLLSLAKQCAIYTARFSIRGLLFFWRDWLDAHLLLETLLGGLLLIGIAIAWGKRNILSFIYAVLYLFAEIAMMRVRYNATVSIWPGRYLFISNGVIWLVFGIALYRCLSRYTWPITLRRVSIVACSLAILTVNYKSHPGIEYRPVKGVEYLSEQTILTASLYDQNAAERFWFVIPPFDEWAWCWMPGSMEHSGAVRDTSGMTCVIDKINGQPYSESALAGPSIGVSGYIHLSSDELPRAAWVQSGGRYFPCAFSDSTGAPQQLIEGNDSFVGFNVWLFDVELKPGVNALSVVALSEDGTHYYEEPFEVVGVAGNS